MATACGFFGWMKLCVSRASMDSSSGAWDSVRGRPFSGVRWAAMRGSAAFDAASSAESQEQTSAGRNQGAFQMPQVAADHTLVGSSMFAKTELFGTLTG